MQRIIVFISILLLTFNLAFSQINPQKISGVYQWCLVHCEAVKINDDFTFDYMFYRYFTNDKLSYKGVLNGRWKVIGENKIQLKGIDEKFKEMLQQSYDEDGIYIDPIYPPEIDFIFIVKKNKLEKLFNDDVEYTLKRLNRRKSAKLFPKN